MVRGIWQSGINFLAESRRFTSVDPLTASATIRNPQTFNRYAYALNSPYKFTDPLGLIPSSTGACGGWCPGGDSGSFGSGGGHDSSSANYFESMAAFVAAMAEASRHTEDSEQAPAIGSTGHAPFTIQPASESAAPPPPPSPGQNTESLTSDTPVFVMGASLKFGLRTISGPSDTDAFGNVKLTLDLNALSDSEKTQIFENKATLLVELELAIDDKYSPLDTKFV